MPKIKLVLIKTLSVVSVVPSNNKLLYVVTVLSPLETKTWFTPSLIIGIIGPVGPIGPVSPVGPIDPIIPKHILLTFPACALVKVGYNV